MYFCSSDAFQFTFAYNEFARTQFDIMELPPLVYRIASNYGLIAYLLCDLPSSGFNTCTRPAFVRDRR